MADYKKKYNSKLEDSLLTRLRLFLFKKALMEDKRVEEVLGVFPKDEFFNKFEIDNELANCFSSQYFQFEKNSGHSVECKGVNKSFDKLYNLLNKGSKSLLSKSFLTEDENSKLFDELKEAYEPIFADIFYKCEEFKKEMPIYEDDSKCEYCGISLGQINKLSDSKKLNNKRSDTRGYSLEIDRKLPNLEYTKENCCKACYWCNNAKTDEFSPKEFKEIARGINKTWNDRLKEIGEKEIIFDEHSELWGIDFEYRLK